MSICLSRFAIQESKKIPIIVHPLKTSSCGLFSSIYSSKHGVRSAAIDFVACYRRDARSREISSFFSFITKRKESKERCENVLSSEAGCLIFQITQCTRFAQTAFRISFLVLLRITRLNIASENPTPSKDLFVRNVFE